MSARFGTPKVQAPSAGELAAKLRQQYYNAVTIQTASDFHAPAIAELIKIKKAGAMFANLR